jgi:hypothetical protein
VTTPRSRKAALAASNTEPADVSFRRVVRTEIGQDRMSAFGLGHSQKLRDAPANPLFTLLTSVALAVI